MSRSCASLSERGFRRKLDAGQAGQPARGYGEANALFDCVFLSGMKGMNGDFFPHVRLGRP
jgi:hypothetical protein